MDFEPFLSDLAEILELDRAALTEEYPLDDTNWDSLAVVSTIASIDESFGLALPGDPLRACQSVGDLLRLIREAARER